ncbi:MULTISPECIES: TonB-dependent receptor [unclassified Arcicella]|uniref:TonB-dependent receptor n=1 Tax=unclassified Arcicella TaxID=2644986 RepID=UPI00285FA831|nr:MULTISPECIES: TonB-dependent receptor [unclassified Arcicella]MDR6563126.1 iron complex outermembrane receptor protein [Arcicella sp. BE51]MDR6811723.1 iron complex outermembrane receptor protein [Arcicella sp. BE140]MDR6823248.1 iron complex outermembrane receptor protein [Arcicella sp. BE139]
MQKLILPFLAILCPYIAFSQNTFKATIKDADTKEPLFGATATLQGTTNGARSDENGLITIKNIPNGKQVVRFYFVGYQERIDTLNFPYSLTEPLEILLMTENEEMEEVIVTSTRSNKNIEDIPTRIETISGEELEEKGNMKPGDIRMMLNETTGIQTQQTSATSYNSSIRIQGLDGKYTQILRDGFPLYAGFSGGLGLLQIAPLDLSQVEVIKGASSTLYGGGAIAGLVNLIAKKPQEKRELSFLLNGTSALGLDASGFYSQKFKKVGTTVFISYNAGTPYDPANIGLTAIPKFKRYTVNPKLFVYFNDKTTLNIGVNTTIEDRIGGDIVYIKNNSNKANSFFEINKTNRYSTQLGVDHQLNEKSKISFKNSISYYDRSIEIPTFKFSGVQVASFSELTYSHREEKQEWITGLNLWTDKFNQHKFDTQQLVDYQHTTLGAFVQNTWNTTEKLTLETGLRGDYQTEYGFFLLPRISALLKVNPTFTMRLGGGMGYKTPTVFTEDAERIQFKNVLPIDISKTKAEESIGGNFDFNYKTPLTEDLSLSINTLFFYTQVKNPLVLESTATGFYEFQQPNGFIDTKGIETNVKLTYNDFKLFIGYTLADVKQHYNGNTTQFPLVAQHRLNNVLMYEIEDKLKIGLEGYYFSPQKLNDGTTGKAYWITGLMVEKLWENFSVFVNFENFLDTRQTKFDTIYTGSISNPTFRDIYAPVDGFVINGGLKIRF